jgi:hypothetical protein
MVDQIGDRVLVPIHWPNSSKDGFETKLLPGTIEKIKGNLAFVKMDEGMTYVTNLDKLQTLLVETSVLEPMRWADAEVTVELGDWENHERD